jgi:hypothetical protein
MVSPDLIPESEKGNREKLSLLDLGSSLSHGRVAGVVFGW